MKKLFMTIATCSMLFGIASCAKESVESVSDGTQNITFKAFLGKQTRAEETDLDALKAAVPTTPGTSTLDVYPYTASGTTVATPDSQPLKLTWNSGSDVWTYSPALEQPGHALRYYSVYPLTTTNFTTAPAATSTDYGFSYKVAAAASQEDLIGASVPATISKTVALAYSHLLSQVNFAVQGLYDIKIDITGLTIDDVKDTGDYTFSAGWDNQSKTTGDYTYTLDETALGILAAGSSSSIVYLGNGGGTNTYTNALMLMPQTFAAPSDGSFSVTFSLFEESSATSGFDVEVANNVTAIVNFSDFDILEWKSGKRYVYVIDFTSYFETGYITFTVDVSDWTDETTTTIAAVQVAKPSATSIQNAIKVHGEANQADDGLAIFPINVPTDIGTGAGVGAITIGIGNDIDALFDVDDVIRIECNSATSAGNITYVDDNWSKTVSGNIVVLTKNTPRVS
jgi:hypothetical protein